jgi:hypothetical protein
VIRLLKGDLPAAWWLGVGVSFSFVTGDVARAPSWMQRAGLEWLHRLSQEPGRLAKRYLLQGIPFAGYLLARSALRGMLPKGKRASRFGRRPRALAVDDDPFALEHLELVLAGRYPELELTKRTQPDTCGEFDFYFLDNDFRGERLAARLAGDVRRSHPSALIFAFSAALDVASLKGLINAGCDGACDKSEPGSWKGVLALIDGRVARMASKHAMETSAFGGVRHAAGSIAGLLRKWNQRERAAADAQARAEDDERLRA